MPCVTIGNNFSRNQSRFKLACLRLFNIKSNSFTKMLLLHGTLLHGLQPEAWLHFAYELEQV